MSNQTKHAKVPMGQKIAFGLGMLANQMFPAALGVFIVVLIEGFGFPPILLSLIFFLPKLFDSISDPIMGFVSDNTKSKWGRRRQYVFLGAVILAISYAFMWQLNAENSITYNFTYFMLWSFAFYLGLTIFGVPFVAMGYEMSDDFHERTSIMAIAQWIGQWAWVIVPWFWVIIYDPNWFASPDVAVRQMAIYLAILCGALGIIPAIFIKSESTLNEDSYKDISLKNIIGSLKDIVDGAKVAFGIKQFRMLCFSTFFTFNAYNLVMMFTFYIIVHYLFNGSPEKAGLWPTLHGSIGALITTFLVIPIINFMAHKIGKKKTFLYSQGISIIGYILFWFLFIPGKPWAFLIALPFVSFGIGGLFTVMMSMTSDVCDLDELNTHQRREGIFGAIYWWMVKLGTALAGALSGILMAAVGFDSSAETQTEFAITGLRVFYTVLPVLGTLAAILIMWNYDIDEKKALEIRALLDKRKKTKSSSAYQLDKLLSLPLGSLSVNSDSDVDFTGKSEADLKQLFRSALNGGMHGMCFSPYAEGQNIGDILSKDQIEKRMNIVAPHTKWVRSFSCTEGNEHIPVIARDKGLKTMVGAWIDNDKTKNELEIENLINLAKDGNVDIAIVGNEVLLRQDLSIDELIAYINRVKAALPNIKVGYVDAYFQFYENERLVDACDVIAINCYPFWEGSSIENSSDYLKKMYAITQTVAKGKQVIIAETGWANQGAKTGAAVPSDMNAMKYFINALSWQNEQNIPMFYFSSFDESWKVHHEGDVGARWGIWDNHENLKY